jgi:hypothetical protein
MRSSGGTNFGPPLVVVARTNSMIAFLAGPSFHDGSGLPRVAVCACAEFGRRVPDRVGSTAKVESRKRRFMPVGFKFVSFRHTRRRS